jgi:hypothetical protein
MQSIYTAEEVKGEGKILGDKFRPTLVKNMSYYVGEMEVLFPPLSSFKIDSEPKKMTLDDDFEYYRIKLEYIETFISTKETLIMDATSAFD